MRRKRVVQAFLSISFFAFLFLATHAAIAARLNAFVREHIGTPLTMEYFWSGILEGEGEMCSQPKKIQISAVSSTLFVPPKGLTPTDFVYIDTIAGIKVGGGAFIDPPSSSTPLRIQIPCPAEGTELWMFQYVGSRDYGPVFANVPLAFNGLDASGNPQIFTAVTDTSGAPVLNTSGDCFQPTSQPVLQDVATHTVFPQFRPVTTGSICSEWVFGPDTNSPTCEIVAVRNGPPKQIDIRVQDTEAGLSTIVVSAQENSTVLVPSFPLGTVDPVTVTATKIDQSQGARVELQATDLFGNLTICDPLLVDVPRDTGRPASETYKGLKAEESAVTIDNSSPGLRKLEVEVNGETFRVTGLADGEHRLLDVSSAMLPGSSNVVTLRGYGKPGSRAAVMISNHP